MSGSCRSRMLRALTRDWAIPSTVTGVPVLGTQWRGSYDGFMKTIQTAGYRALLAWLRQQRLARGLSMRDLGRCLGIAHSWIGKIETGERRLDVKEYRGHVSTFNIAFLLMANALVRPAVA